MRAKDRLSEAVADAGIEEPKEKENWVQMWCNSSRHFVGDHSCCIHPKNYDTKRKGRPKLHKDENDNFWIWEEAVEDPTLLEELDLFLESTTPLVEKVGKVTTQSNESLNASIARKRPKNQHFGKSNSVHAELAIRRHEQRSRAKKNELRKKIDYYQNEDVVKHLADTTIGNMDFYDFMNKYTPKKNDFVFLDPPYDSEFSTYAKNEFSKDDQTRLADYLIKECKANFMIVIKNTEYISSLYREGTKTANGKQLYVSCFDKRYFVSFQDRNEKNAQHLLITNYRIGE